MSDEPRRLPVIDSCEACGACCQVVTRPPFDRVFDTDGEDAWERLKADRPEILAEFLADYRASRAAGGPYFGTPCIWLDAVTLRCRHYTIGHERAGRSKSGGRTAETRGGERELAESRHGTCGKRLASSMHLRPQIGCLKIDAIAALPRRRSTHPGRYHACQRETSCFAGCGRLFRTARRPWSGARSS